MSSSSGGVRCRRSWSIRPTAPSRTTHLLKSWQFAPYVHLPLSNAHTAQVEIVGVSPGHSCVLHGASWVNSPEQFAPPLDGGGLLQWRSWPLVPPPQVALQPLVSDQSPKDPSTWIQINYSNETKRTCFSYLGMDPNCKTHFSLHPLRSPGLCPPVLGDRRSETGPGLLRRRLLNMIRSTTQTSPRQLQRIRNWRAQVGLLLGVSLYYPTFFDVHTLQYQKFCGCIELTTSVFAQYVFAPTRAGSNRGRHGNGARTKITKK